MKGLSSQVPAAKNELTATAKLLRKLVPISQEKMGLFPPRIIKGPTEHLYPRHAYRPISTKLPRGGNCPAFFGLDRCVRKKRDSLRRDPRLPAPLTVVARAGGSPIFAPICCITTKSALKIGAHFRFFRVSHRLMATGSQIPFWEPVKNEDRGRYWISLPQWGQYLAIFFLF